MNNFKRNLLIVLIAGAVSTYSYGMGLLPSQEDMERAEALARAKANDTLAKELAELEAFAKEQAAATAKSTVAALAPSATTGAPVVIPEGSRPPSEQVLPSEVPPAAPPAPREKSVLETTVYHTDAPAAETTAASSSDARAASPKPAAKHPDYHPLITTGEREKLGMDSAGHPLPGSETAARPASTSPERRSPSPASGSDVGEFFDADGSTPRGSKSGSAIPKAASDTEIDKARAAATAEQFAQARDNKVNKGKPAAAQPASHEASAEVSAAAQEKKTDSSLARERSDSPQLEDAMLKARDADKGASASTTTAASSGKTDVDPAAGTSLPPAPTPAAARPGVTFAAPGSEERAAGSGERDRSPRRREARTDEADKLEAVDSSDDERPASPALPDLRPGGRPDPMAKDEAAVVLPEPQTDSLLKKIKRNKLKTLAIILALAEAADLTQAFFLKTTKEELQDKTLMQKAKLIAQKTYTAKLLGAAKEGLINRVVPGILDLKQRAQDYINKKKQTA